MIASGTGFYGLPTCLLKNSALTLEFLENAGPRIVRLFLNDSGENLLAEVPDMGWETPNGKYYLRGGHRLWHAPETAERTSIPDNNGLQIEEIPNGVRLVQPVESQTGIRKTVEITLPDDKPVVVLRHKLRNEGLWPVELAPWAITELPLGGWAILPQGKKPLGDNQLQPDRFLVLWPYARWTDPRLHLGDPYFLLSSEPDENPIKVGYFNYQGWAGYLRNGTLFSKVFDVQSSARYPDYGCNVEVFSNHRFLELETLGPLVKLEVGQTIDHLEKWELIPGLADVPSVLEFLDRKKLSDLLVKK